MFLMSSRRAAATPPLGSKKITTIPSTELSGVWVASRYRSAKIASANRNFVAAMLVAMRTAGLAHTNRDVSPFRRLQSPEKLEVLSRIMVESAKTSALDFPAETLDNIGTPD